MSGEQILVVDDEEIARDNVSYILKKGGFEVLTAKNGQAAIDILRNREVDLVLTDLRMQGQDGMAVLAACHLEIPGDVVPRMGLDLEAVLRLNKCHDAFHIPAPLLHRKGSFMEAIQVVIEKARSSIRDDDGGVWHINLPCSKTRASCPEMEMQQPMLCRITQSNNRTIPYYYQYYGFRPLHC